MLMNALSNSPPRIQPIKKRSRYRNCRCRQILPDNPNSSGEPSSPEPNFTLQPHQPRISLDLLSGHFAPLTVAARVANLDHFIPFDIEYDPAFDILDDNQCENRLQLIHSGVVVAFWSAPPCRLYSTLRNDDGGPPPLRSLHHLDGLPGITPQQLQQVQESQETHRRSSILCTAVFQQGGFAGSKQPINSFARQEPFHQQFLSQCSFLLCCYTCLQMGTRLVQDMAVAATSDKIQTLAGHCTHEDHFNFRGKRLPDGTFISSLSAEYPSTLAAAIINVIKPCVSQSSIFNQSV